MCYTTAPPPNTTLSLHDALPIFARSVFQVKAEPVFGAMQNRRWDVENWFGNPSKAARLLGWKADRKSTRLNSSHSSISYAVFCLKKKKQKSGSSRSGRPRGVLEW